MTLNVCKSQGFLWHFNLLIWTFFQYILICLMKLTSKCCLRTTSERQSEEEMEGFDSREKIQIHEKFCPEETKIEWWINSNQKRGNCNREGKRCLQNWFCRKRDSNCESWVHFPVEGEGPGEEGHPRAQPRLRTTQEFGSKVAFRQTEQNSNSSVGDVLHRLPV